MDFSTALRLPKVELHAHLNGCIRTSTLLELAKERNVTLNAKYFQDTTSSSSINHTASQMYNVHPRSLQDCFDMFAEIPKVVDDLPALRRITQEALQECAAHNVVYLELRSTPKVLWLRHGDSDKQKATKQMYCETILQVMQDFEGKHAMKCRLIVAVDRGGTPAEALEHVELAIRLKEEFGDYVVGVDLGGNPTKNTFSDFRPAFQKARDAGLKITLHCGEIDCEDPYSPQYAEAQEILSFCPDRLGHALLIPPVLQEQLLRSKIPVETCPTSNVMTLELTKHDVSGNLLQGLEGHPQLGSWLEKGHPIAISTDDPGVFDTTATQEVMLVARAFRLSQIDVQDILVRSMDYAFCSQKDKDEIKKQMLDIIAGMNRDSSIVN